MPSLSKILQDYLKENQLSNREFAVRCGITPAYLGKLKKGEMENPSKTVLEKMAFGMGTSIAELSARINGLTYSPAGKENSDSLIPLFSNLGRITSALSAKEADDSIALPAHWKKADMKYFALEMPDDSMKEKSIHRYDILVFERTDYLADGETGSFYLEGRHICRTYWRISPDTAVLEAASSECGPVVVRLNESDFQITGKLRYQMAERL